MFKFKKEKELKGLHAIKEEITIHMPTIEERKQCLISRAKNGITIDEVKAFNERHKEKADYVASPLYTELEVLSFELLDFCDKNPGVISHEEYNELHHYLSQKEIEKNNEITNILVKKMLL